ncbi:MFS transporter [Brevibacillus composti]|uniref:MFS transporter n=1 Tax=Brevibacillus composti TaxID=2796470 RepID=A0A7T5EIF2_9BACL|nr:MFS transporter [Brevibacillus composti]QQE73145.1 MFS transporter [Brevibacillus composti]QUO40223.1 MFS transporter [Brevibacillus composti]
MNHLKAAVYANERGRVWLLVLGIYLMAANLRAPLTAVGPIVGQIRDDTGITNTVAGMLTTLPLLAFALLSPIAPKISRRFGIEQTLFFSALLLFTGILLRAFHPVWMLFLGTAMLGFAIALGNVLIPSLIKRDFPLKVGLMTGVYSMSMNMWAAIASGVSIPIAESFSLGWRGSLTFWAGLSLIALLVWIPQLAGGKKDAGAPANSPAVRRGGSLWRSPLAWKVTLFMGLQSLVFYVGITWIPQILQYIGVSPSASGWLLFLMQIFSVPGSFLAPVLAGRSSDQRMLVAVTTGLMFTGYAGLLMGNTVLLPLWMICIGISLGSAFSLAVMFFALRTRTTHEAAELSGMAQSIGYLLAAFGPTFFGFIRDVTQGWTTPILIVLLVSVTLMIVGWSTGKNVYVSSAEEKNVAS